MENYFVRFFFTNITKKEKESKGGSLEKMFEYIFYLGVDCHPRTT